MGKRRIFIILTFIFLSCQQDMQEFEPEPNVFAVMKIEASYQEILVDQAYNIRDTVDNPELFEDEIGVTGAKVEVFGNGDTFYFEQDSLGLDQPGHYLTLYQRPDFIDTTLYTLEVSLPCGETVTGSAHMPTGLEIIWPNRDHPPETVSISTELTDSSLVTWNSCRNVSKYFIYCGHSIVFERDTMPFPSVTADTCYPFFAERAVWPWEYDTEYELTVVGITPEYEDYLNRQSPGKSNLPSGYGVFTGITYDKVDVYVVE